MVSFRLSAADEHALRDVAARRVRRHREPRKLACRPTMQPTNEEPFTVFRGAGSNIVERAAIPLAARCGFVTVAVAV